MVAKTKDIRPDYTKFISAFAEASKLSISFAFFPVVFLLVGVFLDKGFDTTPLFIVVGVLVGMITFAYQVRKTLKKLKKKEDNL